MPFLEKGPQLGPSLVMIDNSSAERNAFTPFWKSTTPLLFTFHFLQHRWTWLHDAKNGVLFNEHKISLINKAKDLVYDEREEQLEKLYSSMQKCEMVLRYPKFLSHLEPLWS